MPLLDKVSRCNRKGSVIKSHDTHDYSVSKEMIFCIEKQEIKKGGTAEVNLMPLQPFEVEGFFIL
ncbi:MAG: hypothetical protein PHE15_01170 [Dehalococcoidales bacterium]|nr:hypothetical protein [Dehalococcoidales bacterium]